MQESLLGYGCDILNFNMSLLPHLLIDVKRRMLPPSLKVGKSSSWVPTMVMVKVDLWLAGNILARNSRKIGWWWSVEPCICWRFPQKNKAVGGVGSIFSGFFSWFQPAAAKKHRSSPTPGQMHELFGAGVRFFGKVWGVFGQWIWLKRGGSDWPWRVTTADFKVARRGSDQQLQTISGGSWQSTSPKPI